MTFESRTEFHCFLTSLDMRKSLKFITLRIYQRDLIGFLIASSLPEPSMKAAMGILVDGHMAAYFTLAAFTAREAKAAAD